MTDAPARPAFDLHAQLKSPVLQRCVAYAAVLMSASHFTSTHEDLSRRETGSILLAISLVSLLIHWWLVHRANGEVHNDARFPALSAAFSLPTALALLIYSPEEAKEPEPGDIFGSAFSTVDGWMDAFSYGLLISAAIFVVMYVLTKYSRWLLAAPFALALGLMLSIDKFSEVYDDSKGSWLWAIVFIALAVAMTAAALRWTRLTKQNAENLAMGAPFALLFGVIALPYTNFEEFGVATFVTTLLYLLWILLLTQFAPRLGSILWLSSASTLVVAQLAEQKHLIITIALLAAGVGGLFFVTRRESAAVVPPTNP